AGLSLLPLLLRQRLHESGRGGGRKAKPYNQELGEHSCTINRHRYKPLGKCWKTNLLLDRPLESGVGRGEGAQTMSSLPTSFPISCSRNGGPTFVYSYRTVATPSTFSNSTPPPQPLTPTS
ncbi:mCG1028038, partial [Mus musculus]